MRSSSSYGIDFTAAYNIPVEIVRLTGAQTTQRFATEQAAGIQGADIVGTSESAYYDGNSAWFMDLSKDNLPHYVAWPEDLPSRPIARSCRAACSASSTTSDMIKPEDAPKAGPDVIDPGCDGQIILADTQSSVNWGGWLEGHARHVRRRLHPDARQDELPGRSVRPDRCAADRRRRKAAATSRAPSRSPAAS